MWCIELIMWSYLYILKLKCWQYPAIHTNYSVSNSTILIYKKYLTGSSDLVEQVEF